MTFVLTEDQELIRRTIRELAAGPIHDRAAAADHDMRFPRENVKLLGELGLLGILLPTEAGGAGADALTLALACEELAAHCATTGAFTAVTNAWVTRPLHRHASDSVKEQWLPRLLSGDALGTFAAYEDAVGADPFRVRTNANPTTDKDRTTDEPVPADAAEEVAPAVLSGTKNLTFLVGIADLALVIARRGRDPVHRRVDCYAIPTDRDGIIWGQDESKLGLRGYPSGPLYLDKVDTVPEDLVGRPGEAPQIARNASQLLTIGLAACAVGLVRSAVEASVEFANAREQFGVPIGRFQAIQHGVADMRVATDATRNLVLNAAATFDRDGEAPDLAEEANILAFDLAKKATRTAIRTHGGAGFMRDLPVERYARDVRTLSVVGRNPDVSRTLVGLHNLRLEA